MRGGGLDQIYKDLAPYVFRGDITGDLNRLTITPGRYVIRSSNTVTNAPSGSSYCVFIQHTASEYYLQEVIGKNGSGTLIRKYTGVDPTWQAWQPQEI